MTTITSTTSATTPVLSSPGIGSGLDVQTLVAKLVAAEGQPQQQLLTSQQTQLQTELSALGTLSSSLSTFQSAISGLDNISSFSQLTATPSDSSLYTATASSGAIAGTYQVEVSQLAKAQTLVSQGFTDPTATVGTGTLTFQFGDPTKAAQNVTIDSAHSSLQGIRDAVNAANIGVRASIVNGVNGYQLVFAAANTGVANSLVVTTTDADGNNTDMSGLSQLAYDPTAAVGSGQNMTQQTAAQDATVYIDGVQVNSATNTISNALDGVTLNLLSASPGTTTSLTIASDTASVVKLVQNFVSAYNTMMSTFNQLGGYDTTTQTGGPLLGDATMRGIQSSIQGIVGNMVSGLSSASYRALVDIGITTQSDGTLSLDTTKLQTALNSSPDAVARVFGADGVPTDSLINYTDSTSSTQPGTYALNVTQLATQGTYIDTASSISSLTVGSTNDTFAIKVDGIQSGTITLTQKTYASASDLAAELQSKINGDSALQAAGVSVTVAYDSTNNRFTFTSNAYGSASNVDITSVSDPGATSAAIGLTVNSAASTAGLDVAGTIDGQTALGSGQYLWSNTGNSNGLKVQVTGGALGSRGSVTFSRGIVDQLNTYLTNTLDSSGFLASKTSSINSQLSDISDQQTALNTRLANLQQMYLTQYTALDTLLSQMQSTSTFLTNQLSSTSSKG